MMLSEIKDLVKVGQRIKFPECAGYWMVMEVRLRGVVVDHIPSDGHKHLVGWNEEIDTWSGSFYETY